MNEQHLDALLHRAAARVDVGDAPLDALHASAARTHGRRTGLAVLGSIAAVLTVVVGAITLVPRFGSESPDRPVATTNPSPTPYAVPEGMRLVGIGHAAVAVPKDWSTNAVVCGGSSKDTVILDLGLFVSSCPQVNRWPGIDSVMIRTGRSDEFLDYDPVTIDGVPAFRSTTTCDDSVVPRCGATLAIPSLSVTFIAESTTGASTVEEILDRVHVFPDLVAVPGFAHHNDAAGFDYGNAVAHETYIADLKEWGFDVKLRLRPYPRFLNSPSRGLVLSVSPAVGTMVRPGTVVRVTAVR
jgi:hypothetical protein